MNEPLLVSDFDYDLPAELIAQQPVEPRDHSRLLVVDRTRQSLADCHFYDLPELLTPGDLLVLNNTRVIPARLQSKRRTGGTVELLILHEIQSGEWEAIARPTRRLKPGEQLELLEADGQPTGQFVRVDRRLTESLTIVADDLSRLVESYGSIPLPPYIDNRQVNMDRYQTVFASRAGSAAAPTAGLHFTNDLIQRCRETGIDFATVTLHIGLDTFRPIRSEDARDHEIHSEWYSIDHETVKRLETQRRSGGRIIAVGTTSTRVLETIARREASELPTSGWTSLYITPPFEFRLTGGMITNFHLPRTTLLMMVTALAGHDLLFSAYRHAIAERYRFYSFGDAMLIV